MMEILNLGLNTLNDALREQINNDKDNQKSEEAIVNPLDLPPSTSGEKEAPPSRGILQMTIPFLVAEGPTISLAWGGVLNPTFDYLYIYIFFHRRKAGS